MWNRDVMIKAATRHADNVVEDNNYYGNEYSYSDVKNAFLAGCEYITKQIQKEK
jgi:hypothetical protein